MPEFNDFMIGNEFLAANNPAPPGAAITSAITRRESMPDGPTSIAEGRAFMRRLATGEIVSTFFRTPIDFDNLTCETWEMRQQYRALMLKEPAVKAALFSKIQAVANLDPQVIPDVARRPSDIAAAKFLDWSVNTAHGGWPKLIESVAAGALIDGFSVGEKKLTIAASSSYAGMWSLEKVYPCDTQHIRFDIDKFKKITRIRNTKTTQTFDPRDFVVFQHMQLFESPFGISDLRAAYRSANLIESAIKLRAILLENFSGPYLVGKYPDGRQDVRKNMEAVLQQARSLGWIAVPEGADIQVINLATSSVDQFQQTIDDLRKEIYTAIRGAYLPFVEGAKGSERGDTSVQKSITEIFEAWLAGAICEAINTQLVPDLILPNFGNGAGMPRVALGGMNLERVNKQLDIIERVNKMIGGKASKKQVLDLTRVEEAADDADRIAGDQDGGPQGGTPGMPGAGPQGPPEPPEPTGSAPGSAPGSAFEPPPTQKFADIGPMTGWPPAGDDGKALAAILDPCVSAAAKVIGTATRESLQRGLPNYTTTSMWDAAGRRAVVEAMTSLLCLGDLVARARLYHEIAHDGDEVRRFADTIKFAPFGFLPSPIGKYVGTGPERAVQYITSLVPLPGVTDAKAFADGYRRKAFTLSMDIEAHALGSIKDAVAEEVEQGHDATQQIQNLLDRAGVSARSPQYAEMVARTNAMDAYHEGFHEEVQQVKSAFPVWFYSGILDGREGDDHRPNFGSYHPTDMDFRTVRGPRVWNCRCVPIPVHRRRWEKLQREGATLAGSPAYRMFADVTPAARYRTLVCVAADLADEIDGPTLSRMLTHLADDPEAYASAIGIPPATRKFEGGKGEYDEAKHPRDDHGRWVDKGDIAEAKGSPEKADALRARVTDPKQRQALETALKSPSAPSRGKTKKASAKTRTGQSGDDDHRSVAAGSQHLDKDDLRETRAGVEHATNPDTVGKVSDHVRDVAGGKSAMPEHAVQRKIHEKLHDSEHLTGEQKQHYGESMKRVLGAMPTAALDRLDSNLKGIDFQRSVDHVGVATIAAARDHAEYVHPRSMDEINRIGKAINEGKIRPAGSYLPKSGEVFVDGDKSENYPTHEVYAHILGHAIDGPNKEFSKAPAWQDAWVSEIATRPGEEPKLNRYGGTSASEGFAEFSRMVYSGKADPEDIERRFPKATAAFKASGLWPTSAEKVIANEPPVTAINDQSLPSGSVEGHAANWSPQSPITTPTDGVATGGPIISDLFGERVSLDGKPDGAHIDALAATVPPAVRKDTRDNDALEDAMGMESNKEGDTAGPRAIATEPKVEAKTVGSKMKVSIDGGKVKGAAGGGKAARNPPGVEPEIEYAHDVQRDLHKLSMLMRGTKGESGEGSTKPAAGITGAIEKPEPLPDRIIRESEMQKLMTSLRERTGIGEAKLRELAGHVKDDIAGQMANVEDGKPVKAKDTRGLFDAIKTEKERIHERTITTLKRKKQIAEWESSVAKQVADRGGIDPESHSFKTVYGSRKDAIEDGIPASVLRKGGGSLDSIASSMEMEGHFVTPDDRHQTEHLIDLIKSGARSAAYDTGKQDEIAQEIYERELHAANESHPHDNIATAVQAGEDHAASIDAGQPDRGDAWEPDDHVEVDIGFDPSEFGDNAPEASTVHEAGKVEPAEAVIERVKKSPNQPAGRDVEKDAAKLGLEGEFRHVDVPVDELKQHLEDGTLQKGNETDQGAVDAKVDGSERSPVVIGHDGEKGIVADGNHSLEAAIQAGDATVPAIVSEKTPYASLGTVTPPGGETAGVPTLLDPPSTPEEMDAMKQAIKEGRVQATMEPVPGEPPRPMEGYRQVPGTDTYVSLKDGSKMHVGRIRYVSTVLPRLVEAEPSGSNTSATNDPPTDSAITNTGDTNAVVDGVADGHQQAPAISIKSAKTRRGERSVHAFTPGEEFWSAWKKNKDAIKELASVKKDNRTGQWSVSVWGDTPKAVAGNVEKLQGMGAYPKGINIWKTGDATDAAAIPDDFSITREDFEKKYAANGYQPVELASTDTHRFGLSMDGGKAIAHIAQQSNGEWMPFQNKEFGSVEQATKWLSDRRARLELDAKSPLVIKTLDGKTETAIKTAVPNTDSIATIPTDTEKEKKNGPRRPDILDKASATGDSGGIRTGEPSGSDVPQEPAAGEAEVLPGDGRGRRTDALHPGEGASSTEEPAKVAGRGDAASSGGGTGDERSDPKRPGKRRVGPLRDDKGTRLGGGLEGHEPAIPDPTPSEEVVSAPPEPTNPTDTSAGNFKYDTRDFYKGGPRAKFQANLAAIRTYKEIKADGRNATPEEQAIMSKFTGWGSFPGVFNEYYDDEWNAKMRENGITASEWAEKRGEWEQERKALRSVLTDDEWSAATKSTLNAHYTHPSVVDAHWKMAKKLGFDGGRFLETSAGIGYYLGMMPPEIAGKVRTTAVELDPATGGMLSMLYPKANVEVKGFEKHQAPDNYYDLIASNVPFGAYGVHDPDYNRHDANIHDYFFLKSAHKLRPGGLMMHITSTGTLDKANSAIREHLAKTHDLVAAVRFPGAAHKENAGTDVVTDMVILRKRMPGEEPGDRSWIETTTVPDPAGGAPIPVNKYFANNPNQILGTLDRTGSMRQANSMNVSRTHDYEDRLAAAIDRLPSAFTKKAPTKAFTPVVMPAPGEVKEGGYHLGADGKVYQKNKGASTEQKMSADAVDRIKGHLAVRDAMRAVLNAELAGADATAQRTKLNQEYDAFVKEYGIIHSDKNRKAFAEDPDAPAMLALERYDRKSKKVTKADMFTKTTVSAVNPVDKVETVGEGVGVSLHEKGSLDVDHIAKLTGKSVEDVGKELVSTGVGYHDPSHGWKHADEYLSGNVRQKLAMARAAAANDPQYAANVAALEKVQPADVSHHDIDVKISAPWVPAGDMTNFAAQLLGVNHNAFEINHNKADGSWDAAHSTNYQGKLAANGNAANNVWGTPHVPFIKLLNLAMNNKPARVSTRDADGNTVVDYEATDAANEKIQAIKDEFKNWIWNDEERRDRLHRHYNDNFNNIKNIQYNGGHLQLPGSNPAVQLRDLQKNFVWQTITTGKGLAGHEVGTGKTFTAIASAMELRRLGLARKPAILCKKANVDAITADALKLYPGAKILSTADMFDAKSRKQTISRIATGDYDMVIMTHDHFDMLGVHPDTQEKFLREEIGELEGVYRSAFNESGGDKGNRVVKELAKRREALGKRLQTLLSAEKKDDAMYFEDLGIDHLFVDEAHRYKALPVYTQMQNLRGIPNRASQRATGMLMKSRSIMDKNNGRGLTFLTGTPISNTLVELYNMQRYLHPEELKSRGLESFDAWASAFADVETKHEVTATGDYKPVSRLSKFVNLPELQQICGQMLDVQRADNLVNSSHHDDYKDAATEAKEVAGGEEPITTAKGSDHQLGQVVSEFRDGTKIVKTEDGYEVSTPVIKRPKKNSVLTTAPNSKMVRMMMSNLQRRAEMIKGQKVVKGGDNMLKITSDGRKGSIDMRLLYSNAADDESSKTNKMVQNVLKIHGDNPGKSQMIFSDIGVNPMPNGFHLYGDIVKKLVKGGVPREQIVDFTNLTDRQRETAMQGLQDGTIRIALGSTEKLGTGVNAQNKLLALHHLDCPFRPSDLEQRNGRAWRQGNENKEVNIHNYITEGSLDQLMWQGIARKSHFIGQVLKPTDAMVRSAEEEDLEAMSPEQISAAASGDMRVLEKVEADAAVKSLTKAKVRHAAEQVDFARKLKDGDKKTEKIKRDIDDSRDAIETLKKTPDFEMKIDGKTYTVRKEADAAMTEKLLNSADMGRQFIGTYRGLQVMKTTSGLALLTPGGFPLDIGGSVASIEAKARRFPSSMEMQQQQLKTHLNDLEQVKSKIGQPFSKEQELAAKSARAAELQKALASKKKEERPEEEDHGLQMLNEDTDYSDDFKEE